MATEHLTKLEWLHNWIIFLATSVTKMLDHNKPGAIPAGAAASLFNAALNEVVIASLRLDDVEIVLAPAGVNVGIAGVLFLLPFVMGFQRPCRIALVLFKSQNCVLCHKLLSPFHSFPGLFHRKIPPKLSLIGLEWNRYK